MSINFRLSIRELARETFPRHSSVFSSRGDVRFATYRSADWIRQPDQRLRRSGDSRDEFVRFIRATEAPAPDAQAAGTPDAQIGQEFFNKIGCASCHVSALTTAPEGTVIDGGTFTIPAALAAKTIHPYSDFLLHDVGTGDGIIMSVTEHYGRAFTPTRWRNFSLFDLASTQNKLRTPPLWGVRLRSRLMHDGMSLTFRDAILRHQGEAAHVTQQFSKLKEKDQELLFDFLRSL
jgi:CxxC motif-containing protein (DUF1111 family)